MKKIFFNSALLLFFFSFSNLFGQIDPVDMSSAIVTPGGDCIGFTDYYNPSPYQLDITTWEASCSNYVMSNTFSVVSEGTLVLGHFFYCGVLPPCSDDPSYYYFYADYYVDGIHRGSFGTSPMVDNVQAVNLTPGSHTLELRINFMGGGSAISISPGIAAPLPVEFLDVSAKKYEKWVDIKWVTVKEKDNAYFEIERSKDGINFETIGQVSEELNQEQTTYYHFTDPTSHASDIFYRIKQVDIDGTTSYSKVIVVKGLQKEISYVYNNDKKEINVKVSNEEEANIIIADSKGNICYSGSFTKEKNILLNQYTTGFYFFSIQTTGTIKRGKFVIF